jgi:uncharacterized protein
MSKQRWFGVMGEAVGVLFLGVTCLEALAQQKTTLRWGSSRAGSAGYVVLFGVAKMINEKMPDLYIEAVPTGGSIASQRMMAKGELGGMYSGTWNFLDIYYNRGPYEKTNYPKDAVKPSQTWYCYLVPNFLVTRADRTDIKSWRDLAGKKVFVPIPGSAVFEVPKAAMVALGTWDKMRVVDLAYTAVPDAIKMGTVDAAFGYCLGKTLVPWMNEMDSRVKIRVVPQTPEELAVISKVSGYSMTVLDPKKSFSQDVGVDKIHGPSDYYGFHVGSNLPASKVYEFVKVLVENAPKVSKIHAVLEDYDTDPLGMQVKAIGTIPDIPVHPGTAKYLKEKGVWKSQWKIAAE